MHENERILAEYREQQELEAAEERTRSKERWQYHTAPGSAVYAYYRRPWYLSPWPWLFVALVVAGISWLTAG